MPENIGKNNKQYINFIPAVIYTPSTLLGVGGYIRFVTFKTFEIENTTMQLFTLNKQVKFKNDLKLKKISEDFSFWLETKIEKNPLFYYGNEIETKENEGYSFNPLTVSIIPQVFWHLTENFSILIQPSFRYDYFLSFEKNFPDIEKWKKGAGATPGFGSGIYYDTRNDLESPTKGMMGMLLGETFFNNGIFYQFTTDLRYFKGIFKNTVYASRIQAVNVHGSLPPLLLPSLGGVKILRGFRELRFSDKFIGTFDNEIRIRINDPIALAPFIVAGTLGENPTKAKGPLYTGGLGIRFYIPPQYISVVRFDAGFSRDGLNLYFYASHTF